MALAAAVLVALSLADRQGWFLAPRDDGARFQGRSVRVERVTSLHGLDLAPAPNERIPKTTVRLLGLRAPSAQAAEDPASTAREAIRFVEAATLCQSVRLELPLARSRDNRGRLLAYVTLEDGTDLQEVLLQRGLAGTAADLEHPRLDAFRRIEAQAQQAKVGLWARRSAPLVKWKWPGGAPAAGTQPQAGAITSGHGAAGASSPAEAGEEAPPLDGGRDEASEDPGG